MLQFLSKHGLVADFLEVSPFFCWNLAEAATQWRRVVGNSGRLRLPSRMQDCQPRGAQDGTLEAWWSSQCALLHPTRYVIHFLAAYIFAEHYSDRLTRAFSELHMFWPLFLWASSDTRRLDVSTLRFVAWRSRAFADMSMGWCQLGDSLIATAFLVRLFL